MMHVGFVVANYAPHVGGVETHVRAVGQELLRRGHATTVYVTAHRSERSDGLIRIVGLGRHVDVGGVWSVPDPGTSRYLSRDLVARGVTHVSVHTRFFPMTWIGLRIARSLRLPVLLTEHGGGSVRSGGAAMRLASQAVDSTLGRWSLRSADALFAVSAKVADFVHRLSGRDASICGNGIDLEFWRTQGSASERARRLLFVGRIVPEKGWRDFLTVVARAGPAVEAAIAGAGPELPLMVAEIRRLGLDGRVQVLGPQSREQLRGLYDGSVYVNPSVAAEGFQTTLLEAAACGAAIVTYDVGGSDEVRDAGAVVDVVPSGDTSRLVAATRRALDLQGSPSPPAALERYAWPRIADRYETTLRALP